MSVETRYTVAGMTCEHCVRSVTSALSALPGVEQVAVELSTGAVLVHSRRPLEQPHVEQAVQSAGYSLTQ